VRALLPRQHATFKLYEDNKAGGVYAYLQFDPELLGEIPVVEQTAVVVELEE
jgi:hypothetical protein